MLLHMLRNVATGTYYRKGGNAFCWVNAACATVWTNPEGLAGAKGNITRQNRRRYAQGLPVFEVEEVIFEAPDPPPSGYRQYISVSLYCKECNNRPDNHFTWCSKYKEDETRFVSFHDPCEDRLATGDEDV